MKELHQTSHRKNKLLNVKIDKKKASASGAKKQTDVTEKHDFSIIFMSSQNINNKQEIK
jgi:hypothetical protein